jgi:ribokinase
MPARILSLGSLRADFQVRVSEPQGRSETVAATELRRLSGGKAANVALLARRLGHEALLLGRLGKDELAEQVLGPLREAGVDLSAVCCAQGCGTGVSMIAVPPSGKKNIVAAGEANQDWSPQDIEALCRCIGTADRGSVLVADYEVPPQPRRGPSAPRTPLACAWCSTLPIRDCYALIAGDRPLPACRPGVRSARSSRTRLRPRYRGR